jgi:uncharacterized membrane protein YphA (DoxX/SURF4 family)
MDERGLTGPGVAGRRIRGFLQNRRFLGVRRFLEDPYLLFALRLIVGLTLLFSAAGKLPHQAEFISAVQAHGLLPGVLASIYGSILPWLELLAGVLLVGGLFTRFASAVTLLMVISFLIANGTAVFHNVKNYDSACGCFRWITVRTGDALIIDIALVLFTILLLAHAQRFLSLDRVLRRWYKMDEPPAETPAARDPSPDAPVGPPNG